MRLPHLDLARSLALSLGLALVALAGGARSQTPSACVDACRADERAQVTACRGRRECVSGASFTARRCELGCNTTMTEGARCRAECDIDSDRCDAGCQSIRDEGERRGCLRRCGSHHHVSCPQRCPD
ncbi:MAG: hypothetical protein J0L92_18285 [Deltaproteobacteria bacterium]|nr:hypothetical protein [Deltaproteobacteria bacterium]